MPLLIDVAWIIAGVVLLYFGGEGLVTGSTGLARALGVSSLVIGLTVVAFGTSAPELAATLAAAFSGVPEVAFGNVIGSNIANLGLILGIAAIIYPLATTAKFLKREVPFMIGTGFLMIWLVRDDRIGRGEGIVLLALLALYLFVLFRDGSDADMGTIDEEDFEGPKLTALGATLRIAIGILFLVLGAKALVNGAVGVARAIGISERVIGLTLVALGTSLPELAAVVVAAAKRETDLILGNLVGSNIFNILCILGMTGIVHPITVDAYAARLDLTVMVAFSIAVWPFLMFGLKLGRKRGAVLLLGYLAYVVWLFR